MPDPNGPRTVNDLAGLYRRFRYPAGRQENAPGHDVTLFGQQARAFAAEFLSEVVQAANDYIKQQDQGINRQYVDYLARELATNANLSQHQALSDLLVQEERSLMLTGVNFPYAAHARPMRPGHDHGE